MSLCCYGVSNRARQPAGWLYFAETYLFQYEFQFLRYHNCNICLHLLQSFFGFGQSAEVDIVLDGQESRKTAEVKTEDGKKERYYLYYDGETVSGKVYLYSCKKINCLLRQVVPWSTVQSGYIMICFGYIERHDKCCILTLNWYYFYPKLKSDQELYQSSVWHDFSLSFQRANNEDSKIECNK